MPADDLIAIGISQEQSGDILPVPLQRLPGHSGQLRKILDREFPGGKKPLQKPWIFFCAGQRLIAGLQSAVLLWTVVRHVGKRDPEFRQSSGIFLNLFPGRHPDLPLFHIAFTALQRIQQRPILILTVRLVKGDHLPVAALLPVMIDQPVPDPPAGKSQKCPPGFFIIQDCFIESKHGNRKLVILPFHRRPV